MRLTNYSKKQGDTVNIFLLGCGTCLQSRKNDEPQTKVMTSRIHFVKIIEYIRRIF